MTAAIDRLLDGNSLTLTELLRTRIAQVSRRVNVLVLRRLVAVAADDAADLHTFLQDVLATYQCADFDWTLVDDALAAKLTTALFAYRDIYLSVSPMMELTRWWVAALVGLPRLGRLAMANLHLINELLLLLDEDRADVLAALRVYKSGGRIYTLEEVAEELGIAA